MANPNIVSVATILGGNAGWNLSNTLTTTLLTVTAEYVLKINRIVCANVNKVVVVVFDKFQPALPPKMVATDTIFGFAIIYFLCYYYPKTIAIAIACPIDIPAAAGVTKLNAPEPSVDNT